MNDNVPSNELTDQQLSLMDNLCTSTVNALKSARGDVDDIQLAISHYFTQALAAGLNFDQIEDILGVNESCIMNLAELSDADEEVVMDAFESLINE